MQRLAISHFLLDIQFEERTPAAHAVIAYLAWCPFLLLYVYEEGIKDARESRSGFRAAQRGPVAG